MHFRLVGGLGGPCNGRPMLRRGLEVVGLIIIIIILIIISGCVRFGGGRKFNILIVGGRAASS